MDLPIPVSRETLDRLTTYLHLLSKWNERINLVASAPHNVKIQRHFADSAQLFPLISDTSKRLVDMGSGAGFPGLVLAILGCRDVHLVESDKRKCTFLQEVARETGTSVTIHPHRLDAVHAVSADIVTARALAPLPLLVEYASRFLHTNSFCLFPKGANYVNELHEVRDWSFQHIVHPSLVQPDAVILELSQVKRTP